LDRTVLTRVLIIVAVLLALLVGADRIGVYVAESAAADKLEQSQHLDSKPDVDIAGFPFLTQVASGDYDEITVDANDLSVGAAARLLQIAHLHVVLHGVHVSDSFSRVHTDRAVATAHLDYVELGKVVGATVTYAGEGRVRARASVTVLGRTVAGSITARPELHGTSLGFGGLSGAGGTVAAEVTRALSKAFAVEIPLSDIPFQVRVDSLTATPGGIDLQLSGHDLTYVKS
jgi:hypothetical protein